MFDDLPIALKAELTLSINSHVLDEVRLRNFPAFIMYGNASNNVCDSAVFA